MTLPKEFTTVTPFSKIIALLLFIVLPFLTFFIGMWYQRSLTTNKINPSPSEGVACTMEAKICPDGSSVGRIAPNCEFEPCPTSSQTTNWKTYRNDDIGFWFRYPSEWNYELSGTQKGIIGLGFLRDSESLYTITFTVFKNDSNSGSTIEEYMKYYQYKVLDKNGPAATVELQRKSYANGIDGIQVTIGGADVAKEFLFEKDGYLYYFHLELMTVVSEVQRYNEQILEQMISSFTFQNATSEWKSYRNTEYGYTIDYPSDWILKEMPNTSFWSPDNQADSGGTVVSGGIIGVHVSEYTSDKPLSEYYKRSGDTDFIVLEQTQVEIDSLQGIRYLAQAPGNDDGTTIGVLVANDGKLYNIGVQYGGKEKTNVLEVFDRMVASFEFTD